MAEALAYPCYHAGVEDRETVLADWLESGGGGGGSSPFIAATSALGTGVDIRGIAFVLHLGMPRGIINFTQETGRSARRAGEYADSIVLVPDQAVAPSLESGLPGAGGGGGVMAAGPDERAMAAFVEARGCRRAVIGAYLDGGEGTCY